MATVDGLDFSKGDVDPSYVSLVFGGDGKGKNHVVALVANYASGVLLGLKVFPLLFGWAPNPVARVVGALVGLGLGLFLVVAYMRLVRKNALARLDERVAAGLQHDPRQAGSPRPRRRVSFGDSLFTEMLIASSVVVILALLSRTFLP